MHSIKHGKTIYKYDTDLIVNNRPEALAKKTEEILDPALIKRLEVLTNKYDQTGEGQERPKGNNHRAGLPPVKQQITEDPAYARQQHQAG